MVFGFGTLLVDGVLSFDFDFNFRDYAYGIFNCARRLSVAFT